MNRLKTSLGVAAFFAAALIQSSAGAQNREGFAVNRFEPAEKGSHWFANESLDLRGKFRPAVGLTAEYQYRPFIFFQPDGTGEVQASVVRNQFTLHPGASFTFLDRFRIGFNLPIQAGVDGHTAIINRGGAVTTFVPPPNDGGLGDLRFGGDVRLAGVHGDPATVAIGVQAFAPTGSTSQYMSDGKWRIRPRVMVAGDINIFTYAASLAFQYRERDEVVASGSIGSDVILTAAAGVKILDKNLVIGPEFWGATTIDNRQFERKNFPSELHVGAHYLIADQIRVGAFGGVGLNRSFGSPVGRYGVSIEWTPGIIDDRDGDGIKDNEDACPDVRGVRSADPAKNGCPPVVAPPPPADRDNDGIVDGEDACPDTAGVRTGDPSTNGCKDTDGDGIFDPKDACPNEKGVQSQDTTLNGCPDTDGDGIFDKVDACPKEPGKPDPDPKKNGCPVDPDRDKDGIPNDTDACPDEPGKADPDPKRNGCPKAFISQGQIKILDQVKFKLGSAAIDPGKDSLEVLEAVQKVLQGHPEIKKIRIEGHTDKTGSAALNKKLSGDRAASVVKWLKDHGIDAGRMSSVGHGPDKPIDTNDTEQGRKNNRRVEFHIEQ